MQNPKWLILLIGILFIRWAADGTLEKLGNAMFGTPTPTPSPTSAGTTTP
jgi:hypothetical protein